MLASENGSHKRTTVMHRNATDGVNKERKANSNEIDSNKHSGSDNNETAVPNQPLIVGAAAAMEQSVTITRVGEAEAESDATGSRVPGLNSRGPEPSGKPPLVIAGVVLKTAAELLREKREREEREGGRREGGTREEELSDRGRREGGDDEEGAGWEEGKDVPSFWVPGAQSQARSRGGKIERSKGAFRTRRASVQGPSGEEEEKEREGGEEEKGDSPSFWAPRVQSQSLPQSQSWSPKGAWQPRNRAGQRNARRWTGGGEGSRGQGWGRGRGRSLQGREEESEEESDEEGEGERGGEGGIDSHVQQADAMGGAARMEESEGGHGNERGVRGIGRSSAGGLSECEVEHKAYQWMMGKAMAILGTR